MTTSSFMAIAHRGASSYAPENTFAAQRCQRMAAGWLLREVMRQVVEAGADGMTVNFPDKLLAFLRQ